ncbi:hypothetical protein KKC65_02935 [Patescibacteria group bacterium]|nr:hypothetical protein [Patescibacteria group bacterium]
MENNNQQQNNISRKEVQELLNQQTTIILNALSEEIDGMKKKLADSELRINESINRLANTLDAFLKRMTDMEDEFEVMKYEVNKMKGILREKLHAEI